MMRSPILTAYLKRIKAEREDRYSPLQPSEALQMHDFSNSLTGFNFSDLLSDNLLNPENECVFELETTSFSQEVLADIYHSKLGLLEKMRRNIEDIEDKTLLFDYIIDVEGPYCHIISNPSQEMTGSLKTIKSEMLARIESAYENMQILFHEKKLSQYLTYFDNAQSVENLEDRQKMIDQLYIFLQDELAFQQAQVEANKHHNLRHKVRGTAKSKRKSKHKVHRESFVALDESEDTFTYIALLKEILAYMQPWTSIALKNVFLSTVCVVKRGRAETALKKDEAKIQLFIDKGKNLIKEIERSLVVYNALLESISKKSNIPNRLDQQQILTDCLSLKQNLKKLLFSVGGISSTQDLNTAVQLFNASDVMMDALKATNERLANEVKALESQSVIDVTVEEAKLDQGIDSKSGMEPDVVLPRKESIEDFDAIQIESKDDHSVRQDYSSSASQVITHRENKEASQLVESTSRDRIFDGISRKSMRILTEIAAGDSHSMHNCYKAKELFRIIKDLGGTLKNIRGSHYTFKLNQHSFVIVDHPSNGMKKVSGSYMQDFKSDLEIAGIPLNSLKSSDRRRCSL